MPRYVPRHREARSSRAQLRVRWPRVNASVWKLIMSALAIACALAIGVGDRLTSAHGVAVHVLARQVTGPIGFPDVARWQDETNKTSFWIRLRSLPPSQSQVQHKQTTAQEQLRQYPSAGKFSFTLPSGEQIVGIASLAVQQNGDFVATTQGFATTTGAASTGCQYANDVGQSVQEGIAVLTAYVDAHALVAYAQLSFAQVENPLTNSDTGIVCKNLLQKSAYVMKSGCAPSGPCQDVVGAAPGAVSKIQSALVSANNFPQPSNWQNVYDVSSSATRGQYSSAEFADAMSKAVAKTGKITKIEPISSIDVRTSTTGQTYGVAQDRVTFSHGGKSSTREVTTYYLLEGGEWRFWFSA